MQTSMIVSCGKMRGHGGVYEVFFRDSNCEEQLCNDLEREETVVP